MPPSAMTRTLFLNLLGAGMFDTTCADAQAILEKHASEVDLQEDDDEAEGGAFTEIMRAVLRTETEGDPHAVYAVIGRESANVDPVIAAAASKLIEVVEDLRIAARGLHIALAAAVSACRLLTVRVQVPDLWWGEPESIKAPVGVYLAELMRQAAVRGEP
ncbi:hypothetical protein ACQEVZ_24495 [Dactylosporangium sp. CA-152071]|uniref:hypothetical protein n=1 Tax=Dactylosporangium sp. CA-152071 TaxID=3239933 RepID=UPI003D8D8E45